MATSTNSFTLNLSNGSGETNYLEVVRTSDYCTLRFKVEFYWTYSKVGQNGNWYFNLSSSGIKIKYYIDYKGSSSSATQVTVPIPTFSNSGSIIKYGTGTSWSWSSDASGGTIPVSTKTEKVWYNLGSASISSSNYYLLASLLSETRSGSINISFSLFNNTLAFNNTFTTTKENRYQVKFNGTSNGQTGTIKDSNNIQHSSPWTIRDISPNTSIKLPTCTFGSSYSQELKVTLNPNGGVLTESNELKRLATYSLTPTTWSAFNDYPGATVTINSDYDSTIQTTKTIIEYPDLGYTPTPIRHGYSFAGWFNGNTKYTDTTKITGDVNLTAHWEALTYSINIIRARPTTKYFYYQESGSEYPYDSQLDPIQCTNGTIAVTKTFGIDKTLVQVINSDPSENRIRTYGANFVGYGIDRDIYNIDEQLFTTVLNNTFDSLVQPEDGTWRSSVELYPKFEVIPNTIETTYNVTGLGTEDVKVDYEYNITSHDTVNNVELARYTIPATVPPYRDHVFEGWYRYEGSDEAPEWWETTKGSFNSIIQAKELIEDYTTNVSKNIIIENPSAETEWGIVTGRYFAIWIASGKNIKVGGQWRTCNEVRIRVNDHWAPILTAWCKDSDGVWRPEVGYEEQSEEI